MKTRAKIFTVATACIIAAFSFTACNSADRQSNSDGKVSDNINANDTTNNANTSDNTQTPNEATGGNNSGDTPVVVPEEPATPEAPSMDDEPKKDTANNILVVYFSYSNNTEVMANYIQSAVNADIYEIEPVVPYPTTSYMIWGNSAKEERDSDARPEIKNLPSQEEIAKYDKVFIGFPIWWHTAPMIIGTFLENYVWTANVDMYPFFQGATIGSTEYYNNSMAFVRRCAVNADVHEGLYVRYNNTAAIDEYLKENGFIG